MSVYIRVLLIVGAVILLAFMVKRIRQSKLKIEYTIFWIGFSAVLVLMGLFPGIGCKYGISGYYFYFNRKAVF